MAFNSAAGRAEYTATSGQTVFPFTFKIFLDGDIMVYLTPSGQTPDDTADLLTITTDYTVTIDGDNGGSITLVSGASTGDSITIVRSLDINRLIEYQNNGDLLAETLNDDQDYQTYLIADKDTENTRFLRLQDSSQGVSSIFPSPEALKAIRWNALEDALENVTIGNNDTFVNILNVDTIADLATIDTVLYSTVNVRGYYAANDGGGGVFNYDATQSAVNNGGTIINGWVRQYSNAVNVRWFGAKGDNTTDDILAIQEAIDLLSSTGGTVFMPIGVYVVSVPISISSNYTSLIGEGEYATEIKTSSTTENIIEVGDGTIGVSNVWVENISINSKVVKTAGAGILFQNHHFCGARRIRQDHGLFDGIRIEGGVSQFGTYIENCELDGGSNSALLIGATLTAKDTYLSNLIIGGEVGAVGIDIQQASGIFAVNIDSISREIGIKINPTTGQVVRNLFFTNVLADTCESDGWQFSGLGEVSQVNLTNCWASSNGKTVSDSGISFNNADTDGVTISGATVINNGGNGIEILKGTNISIVGGSQIYFNDTDSVGKYGVEIAANVSGWTISGNRIGQGGQFATNGQDYGIFINTGTSDEYIITDNDLTGNVTGSLNSIANGTDIDVRGNKGFVTYNRGTATVLQAVGSVAVTHGMTTTPTAQNIRITPTSDTVGVRWWVSSITSTTFGISFNTTAVADVDFSWEVNTERG